MFAMRKRYQVGNKVPAKKRKEQKGNEEKQAGKKSKVSKRSTGSVVPAKGSKGGKSTPMSNGELFVPGRKMTELQVCKCHRSTNLDYKMNGPSYRAPPHISAKSILCPNGESFWYIRRSKRQIMRHIACEKKKILLKQQNM